MKKKSPKKPASSSYSRQLQEEIRSLLISLGGNVTRAIGDPFTHIDSRLRNIEESLASLVTLGKKREEQMERTLTIHRLMLKRLIQVTQPLVTGPQDPVPVLNTESIVAELEAEFLTPKQPWNDRRTDR